MIVNLDGLGGLPGWAHLGLPSVIFFKVDEIVFTQAPAISVAAVAVGRIGVETGCALSLMQHFRQVTSCKVDCKQDQELAALMEGNQQVRREGSQLRGTRSVHAWHGVALVAGRTVQ